LYWLTMPAWAEPTLSVSPRAKPALIRTVAVERLSAAASAMASPTSSATGVAPLT
jgi:hypothetical protein